MKPVDNTTLADPLLCDENLDDFDDSASFPEENQCGAPRSPEDPNKQLYDRLINTPNRTLVTKGIDERGRRRNFNDFMRNRVTWHVSPRTALTTQGPLSSGPSLRW